jgi:hypothetical protein
LTGPQVYLRGQFLASNPHNPFLLIKKNSRR